MLAIKHSTFGKRFCLSREMLNFLFACTLERRDGIPRPDHSEKSQARRTSASPADDIVKVDVTLAPGLQVKDPFRRSKSLGIVLPPDG